MSEQTRIKYLDLWGLREEKYKWLQKHEVKNTKWQELSPDDPHYFFVSREEKGREEYEKFWQVIDIFPTHSVGFVTARDKFVIDLSEQLLRSRIRAFKNLSNSDEDIRLLHSLGDTSTFKLSESRKKVGDDDNWDAKFTTCLYRPFDERNIYYSEHILERPLLKVMQHMLQSNLALVACRQQADAGFQHALVTNKIVESCYVSNKTREIGYTFPLYLYTDTQIEKEKKKKSAGVTVMMLFDKPRDGGYKVKRPNINPELHALLNNTYNPQPVTTPLDKQKAFDVPPEEIFYYIYAVLYSNTYRQKYQEFLKIDFPRVPFTKDYKLFQKLGKLGGKLVGLHLLKSKELEKPIAKFQGRNGNVVEKREYEKGRVYINDEQYFEGIKPEVWEYQIGGYQVLDKWLKDRKGRALSSEDIKRYCKVATALQKTIKLQKQIDELYQGVEKDKILLSQ